MIKTGIGWNLIMAPGVIFLAAFLGTELARGEPVYEIQVLLFTLFALAFGLSNWRKMVCLFRGHRDEICQVLSEGTIHRGAICIRCWRTRITQPRWNREHLRVGKLGRPGLNGAKQRPFT